MKPLACLLGVLAWVISFSQNSLQPLPQGFYVGTSTQPDKTVLRVDLHLFGTVDAPTGDLDMPYGDARITKAVVEGDRFVLTFSFQGQDGFVRLIPTPGGLSGDWSFGPIRGNLNLASYPYRADADRVTRWRTDLKFLADELKARHPNLYHQTSKSAFGKAIHALDARVPSMTDDQVRTEFLRVTALVGEGHTWVRSYDGFYFAPLTFNWYGKDLRVQSASEQYKELLGMRLVAINGHPLSQVLRAVLPYISKGETTTFTRVVESGTMANIEMLNALGIVRSAREATYQFREDRGATKVVTVEGFTDGLRLRWVHPYRRPPLYLSNFVDLSFTKLPGSVTYVNMAGYEDEASFAAFWKQVFAEVDADQSKRLVVDLRRNDGGDFNYLRSYVLPELKKRPLVSVALLVGQETYSAAVVNAVDLRMAGAVLYGEPTRGRPNNYQDAQRFLLPYSRMVVSYATRLLNMQKIDTDGVVPDVRVATSWDDYAAGRDPVLERALKP